MIRAQARDAYARELSLDRRIQYVHDFLLAKVWNVAQIFPPPDECIRMLNTSISWFLWKEAIFRVPLSTLQRRKDEGGWDLIHPKRQISSTSPTTHVAAEPKTGNIHSDLAQQVVHN